ncbi:Calmodulin-lysine N-methyltransferase-like [Homarus americanus]|uniref:Calmodulin-lysine N-methyltransferase-like n=1 Tax=Homarus americanus TaxID=6706 RepID=A0A8J5MZP1_HOMAM|nr:Calmodulin-lysine N-methyltransferase-like [Homarus americanus]
MTGSNNENCENKSTVARRRWKILAEALQRTSARDASPDSASTRKFQSFGLLSFDSLGQDFYSVRCINWDLKVTVAASGEPSKMVLTDGNALSVNNVKVSLQRNYLPMETYTRVLRWGVPDEVSPHQGKFDVAILFFDEGRESLLSTLLKVLRPGGTALVVAPSRSGTFQTFASMCRPHFMVAVVEKYDQVVDQHVQKQTTMDPYYNKNLHFPLLMILKKKIGTN